MRFLAPLAFGSLALVGCANAPYSPDISEAEMRAEYRKITSSYKGSDYHLRHILLMTESEANEVLRRLDGGASFAAIAMSDSRDTQSRTSGGDIGWAAPQVFGPEIEAAVERFASKGLIHSPIRSKFGWHVVEVLDSRPAEFPPFEDVKGDIESRMRLMKARRGF